MPTPAPASALGPTRLITARFQRLTDHPIDAWAGLEYLVDNDIPESTDLDYKRRPYDDPAEPKDGRKEELRKDVTAFANAIGGVIVIGVTDNDGKPGTICGINGSLDAIEGNLGSVIRSRIWPPLDHVEIRPVPNPDATNPGASSGCILIVVPASPYAPHAVQPAKDNDALKYARRVGRHTEWLTETQVADLYRNRFTAARSQTEQVNDILDDLTGRLPKRAWLLVGLTPDISGQYTVTRAQIADAQQWWNSRQPLGLLPPLGAVGGATTARAGPRRIVLARSDGQTSVPAGVYAELHDDGSCGIALELNLAQPGRPFFHLPNLVSQTLEGIHAAADYSVGQAGAGGYALLAARLHFPERAGSDIQALDQNALPGFTELSATAAHAETSHTMDLDAIHTTPAETVAAAALVAGHLAQHFGEPDCRYLNPAGAIRIVHYLRNFWGSIRRRADELQVPIEQQT